MKLQFKQQDFQIQAVNAVVDVFRGQAQKTNRFTLERSRELIRKAKETAVGVQSIDFENDVLEDIGYRNTPLQVTDEQILKNIQEIQRSNNLKESEKLERVRGGKTGCNLTVEMETGTGKTYTYIRTMYELHRHYGWSKYIVIVPSIAIREGVYKSFQITQDHFQELYGHKINPFIYHSGRPQDIENFASDSRISVMIINTQAFSSPQYDKNTGQLKENTGNRIYRELDQFGSRKPIEIIAQTNPILIIDEPQSVDGEKTLEQMQNFKPLLTLRYSATHKMEYNKVYRLDALDAYNKQLVKKIQVKGINLKGSTGTTGYLYLEQIKISKNKAPEAIIEIEVRQGDCVKKKRLVAKQGDSLFALSGGLPVYENKTIQNINGLTNSIEINNETLYAGDVINHQDEKTFRRIQIRETILSHLQKEKVLFDKGIKVLSLFFIDEVSKYRQYDENGEQLQSEYVKMFEEEYNYALNLFIDLFHQDYNSYIIDNAPDKIHKSYIPSDYENYLTRDTAEQVHKGYFSIDKKGKTINPALKRGSEESDDISAYELIMKDKDRLLSFDEPVRFIFSHSALKEGWDNPNVFQICALKAPESGSQTRRRQEVGRGMRLCVDKNGVRQDFELIGEQVHELNRLTVVASESYEQFAKGLQNEIVATLKDRLQKADANYFTGHLLKNERNEHRITQDDAQKLQFKLIVAQVIDENHKITSLGRELIEQNRMPLPDVLEPFRKDVQKLLKSVYSDYVFMPEDERKIATPGTNKNFAKQEFQELWDKISRKTIYEVKFDTSRLIADSCRKINSSLNVSERIYQVKTGEMKTGTAHDIKEGLLIKEQETKNEKVRADLYINIVYDIVGELEQRTNLKRSTIVTILKGISPQRFVFIHKNPEEFIAKSAKLINEVKASLIFNNIVYHKMDDRHDAKTVFTNDKSVLRSNELLKKHIYDYLTTDSRIEADFARDLENATEVVVYAKLPKSFYITTPVANYTPDWAIVFDKDKVRHIYFIAETKGSESDTDLREIEKLKIHCAEKHFETISGGTVTFSKVKTYDKLLEIIQLKQSV